MSRQGDSQHVSQHSSGAGGHDAGDLDDDHAPDAARRVSTAALRKKASSAEAAIASASKDDRDRQHRKADKSELHGLQAAIMLAARHLQEDALVLKQIADRAPEIASGEAGAAPLVELITARVLKATDEIDDLSRRIGKVTRAESGMTESAGLLAHELGALKHAVFLIDVHVIHASNAAFRRGAKIYHELRPKTDAIKDDFQRICRNLALDEETRHAPLPDTKIDARPESELFATAMDWNLTAACDAARSVRMSHAASDHGTASSDLMKMIRHVGVVADLIQQTTDGKRLKAFKPRLRLALAEVRSVENAVAGTPALERPLADSSLATSVQAIHARAQS